MATYEDLLAAVDAIRKAYPDWDPRHVPLPGTNAIVDNFNDALSQHHSLQQEAPNELFATLRQLAPPGAFSPSGQLAGAPKGAPNLPPPGAPPGAPPIIPGPAPGKPVDRTINAPQNHLDQFQGMPGRNHKAGKAVPYDPIPTYIDGYKAVQDVTAHGPGNTGWNATIDGLRGRLKKALATINSGIEGQFGNALRANLERSFGVLDDLSNHARTMETLIDAFFNDLQTTKDNFARNWELYRQAIQDPQDPTNKETLNQLNALVGPIMAQYRPPIDTIAQSHPSITSALPSVGSPGSVGSGGGGGSQGGTGGGPVGLPRGGLNTGSMANLATPDRAQPDQAKSASPPQIPTDAANGAADAAKQAGDQAQKAAGQGADAAQKALGALGGAPTGAGLPEGVLGLGPKGLQGAAKTGGGGGGRGAGGREPVVAKTPAKLASSPNVAGTSTPASRAGVSGSGAPGAAGAPAAGHRGAAGDKTHKAGKALRLTKNGEEVIGEADAINSVIGDEPRKVSPDPKA
ncbi:hypothetical protein [Mycobacterium sp. Z3061]|uniref:hypothetical protein n=1 Tax=Mycobacterium sp. Z3061 TaxID=3073562 RepID=UPI00287369FC|nr:hypothetical protein [Mycobacterium sp. Z3061]